MKKGFTMLEILVVLVIVAMLFGLGTAGLMRLKSTMDAEQGLNQVINLFKSEKNKAKNNVVTETFKTSQPTIYANLDKYILGTKFTFNYSSTSDVIVTTTTCWRLQTNPIWNFNTNCLSQSEDTKTIGGIKFANATLPNVSCNQVLFENLTEKMVLNTAGANCSVNIITSEAVNPPYRVLTFYSSLGYYDVK